MYINVAINVEDKFSKIKEKQEEIENSVSFNGHKKNNLPLHLSLCISKNVDDSRFLEAVEDVESILKEQNMFVINTDKIEIFKTLVWIRYKEDNILCMLHQKMVDLFTNKYGCNLDSYDVNFMYHTTLLMDNNQNKIEDAYCRIRNTILPSTIMVNSYVISYSKDGNPDSYQVLKTINKN